MANRLRALGERILVAMLIALVLMTALMAGIIGPKVAGAMAVLGTTPGRWAWISSRAWWPCWLGALLVGAGVAFGSSSPRRRRAALWISLVAGAGAYGIYARAVLPRADWLQIYLEGDPLRQQDQEPPRRLP